MRNTFILITFLLAIFTKAQHYASFSQYIVNGLVINPAYAGRNGMLDLTLAHRRQWTGFDGAPVSTSFSANTPVKIKGVSLGLTYLSDQIGTGNNQTFNFIYAYRLKIGKVKLSFGLQNGLSIQRTNWDKLRRNDKQDGLINGQSQTQTAFMSGAGIYVHNKNLFAGFSVPYMINTLNKNSIKENPILLSGGYFYALNADHSIKPSLLLKLIPGTSFQTDINLNYYYKNLFGLGLSYRIKESIVGILEYGVNKQFRIYYSYDYGISQLKNYHGGSHEILLRYYFGYSFNALNPRDFQ